MQIFGLIEPVILLAGWVADSDYIRYKEIVWLMPFLYFP